MKFNKVENPKRLAAYMRVSSTKQRDAGTIEIQRQAIAKYCIQRDIEILEFFEDDGISGTKPFLERPQGSALWEKIEAGEFDGIVTYKVDRLARSLKNFVDFCELILAKKCTLILVDNDFNIGTDIGKMILGILAVFSEWEHSMILDRAMSGKRRKLNDGKILGQAPYGYQNINNKLVIDPIRAKFVKQIFEDYANNSSYRQIMQKLNDSDAPVPPGRSRDKWAHHHIQSLLKNPTYFGEYQAYRTQPRSKGKVTGGRDPDDIVKIEVPGIISKELFDRVQKKISENRWMGPKSKKRFYLLRGLIRCGICGYVYVGRGYRGGTYKRKTGKRIGEISKYKEQRSYECSTKYKAKLGHIDFCGNASLNAFEIENLIWTQIEEFLLKPSIIINKMLAQQREESKKANTIHKDAEQIKSFITKAKTKRKRIVNAISNGTMTDEDAKDALDEIRREILAANEQKEIIEQKLNDTDQEKQNRINSATEILKDLAVKFKAGLNDEEKRSLVEALVGEIKVFKEYPNGEPINGESKTSKPHMPVVKVKFFFDENGFSSALSHSLSER